MSKFKELVHKVDFCVVGGGLSGLCAAIAAARQGLKVALIQDRPVLGGNASSEIRMWICGAHGENNRETGLVEEMQLENNFRNPYLNFSIWDSVLFQFAWAEENLQLFMNASVNDAVIEDEKIKSVKAWQTTSQIWHIIEADFFADCSGDSVLAPLCGAEFRVGREARAEFNEDIQPETADNYTMGMSCLVQARETDSEKKFIPPPWAKHFPDEESIKHRVTHFRPADNFWWLELGGDVDSIHDTEEVRDELLALAFGVWDYFKNRSDKPAINWELEWVGFLPGKRESRRYVGDLILTQNDVRSEGKFSDIIAYGGWSMDDHHPGGFHYEGAATIFHPAPSPYGIPYRCIYSKNIENLFFAGRNISVSHAALSSTRVMATCALLGQAAGTAVALAAKYKCSPREVGQKYIEELQQQLMDDDCYIPWKKRKVADISLKAKLTASEGDPEAVRNGYDRPCEGNDNSWSTEAGGWLQYDLGKSTELDSARIVFDSDLNRIGTGAYQGHSEKNIVSNFSLNQSDRTPPKTLVKSFELQISDDAENWQTVVNEKESYQRLIKLPFKHKTRYVKLKLNESWGAEKCKVFAFEVGN